MKLNDFLLELFDSDETYEFERLYGSGPEGTYSFKTSNQRTYEVYFEIVDLKRRPGAAVKVDYVIVNKKHNFTSNDNDQFKVFRTIAKCISQHIRSIDFSTYSALDYLIVRGVDDSGKFSTNNKRSRIYKYLLKKNGYSPKVDIFYPDEYKSGKYIYIELQK